MWKQLTPVTAVNRGTVDRLNLPMPSTSDLDENGKFCYMFGSWSRKKLHASTIFFYKNAPNLDFKQATNGLRNIEGETQS